MIAVSIVEDDRDIRESLCLIINGTPGYSFKNTYGDCETMIADIEKHPPEVMLMDIGLPGMSGIEGIRIIREKLPDIDIIMLTIREDDDSVFESLCAGACGYLIKDTSPALLLDAIREVHEGGAPMNSHIARKVTASFRKTTRSPLTPRETEVLHLIAKGHSYLMIADTLFVSEETIRTHVKNIYRKLEVGSKVEAVTKAYEEGFMGG